MGTYYGKSLWKLSFQCFRFLSEIGGMAISLVRGEEEELVI